MSPLPRLSLGFLACFFVIAPLNAQQFAFKDTPGQHLDVVRDGKPVIRYMYAFDTSNDELRHKTYKVYHHVFDPSGKQLITKGPGGKFTHHRGLFIGFSRTGYDGKTYDLWHMKNQCSLVHQEFLTKEAGSGAKLGTLIHWDIAPDKTILEERRTLTVHPTKDSHLLIDWHSELKAVAGEVHIKADPEHGGMQYRPANDVADNKSAQYVFPKDGADPKRDKDLPWVALTYRLANGDTYTVQHMRHPNNPGNSVYSAYRDYGRFGNYFETTIEDGATLQLQYRFRITEGEAPSREQLAAHYQTWVTGAAKDQ